MTTLTAAGFVPPIAAASSVPPRQAAELVAEGTAFIVDIREPDEHRYERVPGSTLYPDSAITRIADFPAEPGRLALVLCNSGNRASQIVTAVRNSGRTDVAVVDGGIIAWRQARLPVTRDAKAALPIIRQVMIVAGLMQVAFTVLAATVSPWFLVGTGFVGFGLAFAGLTGFCPMATVLAGMPWNRASAPSCGTKRSATDCASRDCDG